MKNKKNELMGNITSLRGNYGIIISEIGDEYYFNADLYRGKINLNDRVIFLRANDEYYEATAIRKVYTNKQGIDFYSRVNQHHIHLQLESFLPDLIDKIDTEEKEFIEIELKFPQIIGTSSCVTINNNDNIIYAKRKDRKGYSKFVKNREPIVCNSIFAVFKKTELGYLIVTIYIGEKAGREPWDKLATVEDYEFWTNHALIYDRNEIRKGTEIISCPWNFVNPQHKLERKCI
jgi:hypothetical protein